jgi:Septum formation
MTERWICALCSTENDPWVVGCSKCGTVRADLSVAGAPQPSPAADALPLQPVEAPPPTAPPLSPWPPPPAALPPGESAESTTTPLSGGVAVTQPPQAASVPLWRRLPIGWILFGVLVFGGAIGGLIFNASRGSSGEITKSGDLEAGELRAGDCFDLKDPTAEEIGDVTALPCTSEHEYETFFVGTMPPGDFPTDDGFNAWLEANCAPAFEAYVGTPLENSELEVFWLSPTSEAWNAGERSIQCAINHPTIHRLTESFKGSGR